MMCPKFIVGHACIPDVAGISAGFSEAAEPVCSVLFPTDQLQIQHDEGIEDGNEPKRHESGDRQSPNLRIAKRLPKRAAVCSQRKQRNHCGRNRDHHWPQTKDAGIDQRQLQFLALFSSLLDKFKQHNDVAHNYTDEADDPKECHESKGLAHNGE